MTEKSLPSPQAPLPTRLRLASKVGAKKSDFPGKNFGGDGVWGRGTYEQAPGPLPQNLPRSVS
jgi:hypothetical protein